MVTFRASPGVYKEVEISGSFDRLSELEKEFVMELVANFHYRNGVKHDDGSMGEIIITPRQMNDCIAFAIFHEEIDGRV
jgi:hypothetical protein